MRSTEQTRELAGKTENQIRLHPETHDQAKWVSNCGTTACAAGWACKLAGLHEFHVYQSDEEKIYQSDEEKNGYYGYATMQYYVTNHGVREFISNAASELLGLARDEENWLFDTDRTREEVLDGLIAIREGDQTKLTEMVEREYDDDDGEEEDDGF